MTSTPKGVFEGDFSLLFIESHVDRVSSPPPQLPDCSWKNDPPPQRHGPLQAAMVLPGRKQDEPSPRVPLGTGKMGLVGSASAMGLEDLGLDLSPTTFYCVTLGSSISLSELWSPI